MGLINASFWAFLFMVLRTRPSQKAPRARHSLCLAAVEGGRGTAGLRAPGEERSVCVCGCVRGGGAAMLAAGWILECEACFPELSA
jgi:hypothetical protein